MFTESEYAGGHIPVLLEAFLKYSDITGDKMWDATAGAGGHACAFALKHPDWNIFLSDTDQEMLNQCKKKMRDIPQIKEFKHANFAMNPYEKQAPFDIIFLDLGISSLHLDTFQRGISYRESSHLDMRLDTSKGITAEFVLNSFSEKEIRDILFNLGEERFAPIIAKAIIRERHKGPIKSTVQLVEICKQAFPQKLQKRGESHTHRHPYVKTFQALRIYVNDELGVLSRALAFLPDLLSVGGRCIIISFHSLEDRLVKNAFRTRSMVEQTSPLAKSNFIPGNFQEVTRKPVIADLQESEKNQRARSAKMRVLERVS